jgi:transcriptional regulator with GAF, ATPase, and Fis domain
MGPGNDADYLQATPNLGEAVPQIVLRDPRMREIYSMLDVVAPSPFPILVLGETGVGKDVFAAAAHGRSRRAARSFVQLNCAAMPDSLLESELFGHERGAFTGAHAAMPGLFEAADGGTVFLDEIGELALTTQAKLLRVLENGEVRRVGTVRPRRVDVRIVAATNRDLMARCEAGVFRSDLYFRLASVVVTIPPLRERPSETEPFADHFARDAARRLGRPVPKLTQPAIAKLKAHDWPGNIRELRNVMHRAVLQSRGGVLGPDAIHFQPAPRTTSSPPESSSVVPAPPSRSNGSRTLEENGPGAERESLGSELKALERERIVAALEACGGNQSHAARTLGMPRRSLLRRIEEFGLTRPRKRNLTT